MVEFPYRRRHRLRHKRQFDAVFAARNSSGGEVLVVYGLANHGTVNRLGLSIGRRFGNAVVRNRFKRLCREAFRLTMTQQPCGWDWLVLPKIPKGGARARRTILSLDQIRDEMLRNMARISKRRPRPGRAEPPVDSTTDG